MREGEREGETERDRPDRRRVRRETDSSPEKRKRAGDPEAARGNGS